MQVYLLKPEKPFTDKPFIEIDKVPVWNLGNGVFQIICEEVPKWAIDAVELSEATDKPSFLGKFQEATEVQHILPTVVMAGMVPEELIPPTKRVFLTVEKPSKG